MNGESVSHLFCRMEYLVASEPRIGAKYFSHGPTLIFWGFLSDLALSHDQSWLLNLLSWSKSSTATLPLVPLAIVGNYYSWEFARLPPTLSIYIGGFTPHLFLCISLVLLLCCSESCGSRDRPMSRGIWWPRRGRFAASTLRASSQRRSSASLACPGPGCIAVLLVSRGGSFFLGLGQLF